MADIQPAPQDTSAPTADSEVGTLAGVIHLLFFAQTFAIVVAAIIWATRGKRSSYLAFHCAQALIIQVIVFVGSMMMVVGFFAGVIIMASVSAASDEAGGSAAPALVGLPLLFGGFMLMMLLYLVLGGVSVWAAVRCFQDGDPRIPVIGNLATRLTGHHPATGEVT